MSLISFSFQFHFTQFFISVCTLYCRNTRAYTAANYSQIHKVVTMFTKLRLDVYSWCQSSVDGSICWLQLIKLNRLCWFSSVCGELPITSLLWVEWYDNCCSCGAFTTLLCHQASLSVIVITTGVGFAFCKCMLRHKDTVLYSSYNGSLPTEPGIHS